MRLPLALLATGLLAAVSVPLVATPALAAGQTITAVATNPDPPATTAGAAPTALTITGTGFTTALSPYDGDLHLGGVTADIPLTNVVRVSDTQLTAKADLALADPGTYDVEVGDGNGDLVVGSNLLAVTAPALSVTDVTPAKTVAVDGRDRSITVTGTGFTRGTTVKVGTLTTTDSDVVSGTQLNAHIAVPLGTAPGDRTVTVTRRASADTGTLTIATSPTLTFSPPTPLTPGGAAVDGTFTVAEPSTGSGGATLNGRGLGISITGPSALSASDLGLSCSVPGDATLRPVTLSDAGGAVVGECLGDGTGFPVTAGATDVSLLRFTAKAGAPGGTLHVTIHLSDILSGDLSGTEASDTGDVTIKAAGLEVTWPTSVTTAAAPANAPATVTNPTAAAITDVRFGLTLSGLPGLLPSQVHLTCASPDGTSPGTAAALTGTGTLTGTCGPAVTLGATSTHTPAFTIAVDDLAPTGALKLTTRLEHSDGTAIAAGKATIQVKGRPGQPVVTATGGDTTLSLAFTAPFDGNDGAVTWTATVSQCTTAACTKLATGVTPVMGTSTTSPIDVGGLKNGLHYLVSIVGTNTVGDGPAGTLVDARPYAPPSAPTSVTSSTRDGALLVSFALPATNPNVVDSYIVTATPQAGSPVSDPHSGTATSSPVLVSSLVDGITYDLVVVPQTTHGVGPSATGTGTPLGVPGAPQDLVATPGDGIATLTFTPPATNPFMVTGYVATLTPHGGGAATQVLGPSSPLTVSDLLDGTTYDVSLATTTVGGGEGPAAIGVVTPSGPPGAARAVTVSPGDGQALVTFQAPELNPGVVGSYVVHADAPGHAGVSVPVARPGLVTLPGLTNGVTWSVTVEVVPLSGPSVTSAPVTVVPFGLPAAPSTPTIAAIDGGVVVGGSTLADDGGRPLQAWLVTVRPPAGAPVLVRATTLPARVLGLTDGLPYTATVSAVTAAGQGPASASSTAVVPRAHVSLTIAKPPASVRPGGSVVLTGRVVPGLGGTAQRVAVHLQSTTDRGTSGRTLVTKADGTFSVGQKPQRTTTYILSVTDTDADGTAVLTRTALVTVVQTPKVTAVSQKGTRLTVRGTLTPLGPRSADVLVGLWTVDAHGTLLRKLASAHVKRPAKAGDGTFSLVATVPVPSEVRVVVRVDKTKAGPRGGTSSVVVRRLR